LPGILLFFFVFFLCVQFSVLGSSQHNKVKKGSKPFKKLVMLKSKIKIHKSGAVYKQPHFFILNKGLNSGKPFNHYVCNSFVFLADDENEKEFFYFLLLGIWELRLFRPYLKG